MPNYYRYTRPVPVRAAQGQVAEIYAQLRRDLGSVADPIALHAPHPPMLAGAWAILRETLLAGQAPRGHKEAVAASVSTRNRCPWCVDIHGMMLAASCHGEARSAIAAQHTETIAGPQLRSVVAWAGLPLLEPPPGAPSLAPELVGTAVTFHYTVFIDPQLGRVGLGEEEARAQGREVRVVTLARAQAAWAARPFGNYRASIIHQYQLGD